MELKAPEDFEKFISDQDASVIGVLLFDYVNPKTDMSHVCLNFKCNVLIYITVSADKQWKSNTDVTLISSGFFDDDKSTAQTEFLKAASALRDNYRFAHTNSEALLKSHDISGE